MIEKTKFVVDRKPGGYKSKAPDDKQLLTAYATMTAKEIGQKYGVAESTARGWIQMARKRARLQMKNSEPVIEPDRPATGYNSVAKVEAGSDYTHATNADRIRAMSNENLAKLFVHTVADGCPPSMDWNCARDDESGWDACDACWARWLQQPAEDE